MVALPPPLGIDPNGPVRHRRGGVRLRACRYHSCAPLGAWTAPYLALMFVIRGTPELVSAIVQMIWFDRLGIYGGLTLISIRHSSFDAAVVTLKVRARAEDLGSPEVPVSTSPSRSRSPAMLAGALLFFTFSFDEVIISLFVHRPGSFTSPLCILSSVRASASVLLAPSS